MARIGAHMSIAGGLPRAVERAQAAGCEALQIFTKSANQWRARPLPAGEIAEFRQKVSQSGVRPVVAHNSYLINVAASDSALRDRSIESLLEEYDRADALGLMGLVMHPGCFTHGEERTGLRLIADALSAILGFRRHSRTMLLLEHTAGQGTSLGHRFEHLAEIIQQVGSARVGICLDTCHLLASGYDICSERGYRQAMRLFDAIVGLDRLEVLHLNDSKRPCGSRVDRHEHIGRGCLGAEPFRRILQDPRLQGLPMLLETPKTEGRAVRPGEIDPLDEMNLTALRRLRAVRSPRKRPLRT